MPNNQFNGSADQIENNVNKKDVFDPNLSDEAKSIGYPSLKLLVNLIHPVGSFYISSNPTEPSKIFGGTWEQIKDVFLLSAGDIYSAGTTGGEAEHKLTVDEMPSHEGHLYGNEEPFPPNGPDSYFMVSGPGIDSGLFAKYKDRPYIVTAGNEVIIKGFSRGGTEPHNNMPPYLAVYMWRRTA